MKITKQQLRDVIHEELVLLNEDATKETKETLTKFERRNYITKKMLPAWYLTKKLKERKSEMEKFGLGEAALEYIMWRKKTWLAKELNKEMPPWVPKETIADLYDKNKDPNLPQV